MKLAVGSVAPDFTVKTPDDKPISLSEFRGRYVLVDFWASWCRPCRIQNPALVLLYQKFKGPRFEIFGVSLDQRQESWVQAIQTDGLTWKHGSDLGYWNSAPAKLYEVSSIPYSLILDPEGKIVAKNLHGTELEAKLAELLGH
jgi:peroxiredoxin